MNVTPPHELAELLVRHVGYLNPSSPQHVRIASGILSELVQTVFFASIATEEGRTGPLRVVFSERDPARRVGVPLTEVELPWTWRPRLLKEPRPFEVEELTQFARVLQSRHSYILVGETEDGQGLEILGLAHEGFDGPYLCMLAPRPGLLQVQFTPESVVFEYRNGEVRLAPPPVFLAKGPVRRQLIGAARTIGPEPELGRLFCTVAGALVHAMDDHGRGGILVLLPRPASSSDFQPLEDLSLQAEMQELVRLRLEQAALGDPAPGSVAEDTLHAVQAEARWHEQTVRRLVVELAGFSAADGALLLGSEFEIVAFGEKLPIEHEFAWSRPASPSPTPTGW